jgi:hypothetical protein
MPKRRYSREVLEAFLNEDEEELDRLLGLRPWEVSPLRAIGPCPYQPTTMGFETWPKAQALRAQLLAQLELPT